MFLHPETHDEYALARIERKTGRGYHGFSFHAAADVTLEEDLARRDLTINAMAKAADGTLVDPFNGQQDLASKTLRHVGPAFAEDPVRILRIARFAARFSDFSVAPETLALMRHMVASGEVDHLVAERVWQELAKGLMEQKPSRMFEVLRDCGALARLLPEVEKLFGVPQRADYHPEIDTGIHTMMVVDQSARRAFTLPVRFAALTHDLGKAETPADILPRHIGHEERSVRLTEQLCGRLRVPNDCRDLALADRTLSRQHPSRRRPESQHHRHAVRKDRCAAPAGTLPAIARRLSVRLHRPPGLGTTPLRQSAISFRCPGGGHQPECRRIAKNCADKAKIPSASTPHAFMRSNRC